MDAQQPLQHAENLPSDLFDNIQPLLREANDDEFLAQLQYDQDHVLPSDADLFPPADHLTDFPADNNFQLGLQGENNEANISVQSQDQHHVIPDIFSASHLFTDDDDSLFIPENSPPQAQAMDRPNSETETSARPLPASSKKSTPSFFKILAMHEKLNKKRIAARKDSIVDSSAQGNIEMRSQETVSGPSSTPASAGVDQDHEIDRRARKVYEREKRRYDELRRKNGGVLSTRHDVEWMRIQGDENYRLAKRERDLALAQEEQDEDEFVLFPIEPTAGPSRDGSDEADDDHDGSNKRHCRRASHKQPTSISIQEAELRSMKAGSDAIRDKRKKKSELSNDNNSQAAQSSNSAKNKGKAKATKHQHATRSTTARSKVTKSGGRRGAKGRKEDERTAHQVESLLNADVFRQQAGMGAREQPTFESTIKEKALRELIASLPTEDREGARDDMNMLLAATKDFDGKGAVKADGCGMWRVRGMKTSLKAYQVLGTAFMRRRENSEAEPRGGILADQMGLGKTLTTLANIINGQPTKGATGPKTTLIVASPALLSQWNDEIRAHTDCKLKLLRYGSGNRVDSNHAIEVLTSHDIVMTTYHEIMRSYPKNEPPAELQTTQEKNKWWEEVFEKERGILHRIIFLRVVLDEAQAIKNHLGRTSIACRALMADHRWALSGTPISNSLTELYPYFKFLNVPHTGSFEIFKQNYCQQSASENMTRLVVRLGQFMLRRTHTDIMFGAPILKLPLASQINFRCQFNFIEREIYNVVERRFAQRITKMKDSGNIKKSFHNILVMLLRLRQLTAHVLVIQFVMRDLLEPDDIKELEEIANMQRNEGGCEGEGKILAIRKHLQKLAAEEQKRSKNKAAAAAARATKAGEQRVRGGDEDNDSDNSNDEDLDDNSQDNLFVAEGFCDVLDEELSDRLSQGQMNGAEAAGGRFGRDYDIDPILQDIKRAGENPKCSQCGKQARRPFQMSCGHHICSSPCRTDADAVAASEGREFASCKTCQKIPTYYHLIDLDDERPSGRTRQQGKQGKRNNCGDIPKGWLDSMHDDLLPSAKTIAVKAQIINWVCENPDVKIIVYTQFLVMIQILARVCQMEGWHAEQYHGKMSFASREKAISSFAQNPESKILLASMRSGGLGLNLTMASKVIIIDPWWNMAAEQQAFCRVFRIGQKEETFMSRLCVEHTVDERLHRMQERKQREINSVMEGDLNLVKKLSIDELMNLFDDMQGGADDG